MNDVKYTVITNIKNKTSIEINGNFKRVFVEFLSYLIREFFPKIQFLCQESDFYDFCLFMGIALPNCTEFFQFVFKLF